MFLLSQLSIVLSLSRNYPGPMLYLGIRQDDEDGEMGRKFFTYSLFPIP
jgi:hypothetical protein